MEKFNQINTGMKYSQVVNIIGFEGTISSQANNIKTYTWQQSSKIISIVFTDDKVSAKSQIGLSGQAQVSENEGQNGTEQQTEVRQNPVVTMLIEGYGNIAIELYPDMAPNTVANFIHLVQEKYYNGQPFDRIVENLMIQCGNEESKDIQYSIEGEFAENGYTNNTLKFERGTIRTSKSKLFSS